MYPLNMVFGLVPRPQLYPKAGAGTPTRRPFFRAGDTNRVFANHGQRPLGKSETIKCTSSSPRHLRGFGVCFWMCRGNTQLVAVADVWVPASAQGVVVDVRICG